MSVTRAYQWTAGIVVVLSVLAYAMASERAELGLAAVVAAIGWVWSSRLSGRLLLPRWLVNTLVFGSVGLAAINALGVGLEVGSVAILVVFLLIIKLGDRRTRRDDAQILMLAVFLGIAAMLDSNRFAVGLSLLVLTPLVALAVMLFHLHPVWSPIVSADGREGRGARGIAAWAMGATAAIACVAAVVFVVMPRGLGESQFGQLGRLAMGSVTGFTNQVNLGRRNVISESPEVVMDVSVWRPLPDAESVPLGGVDTTFYLRGAVLDEYNAGQWRASVRPGDVNRWPLEPGATWQARPAVDTPLRTEMLVRFRRGISAGQDTPLFTRWQPHRLRPDRRGHLVMGPGRVLAFRAEESGPMSYRVEAVPPGALPPAERPRRSVASPGIEGLAEITGRVLQDANLPIDPAARTPEQSILVARAIESWLRNGFAYSLEERPVPEGRDPTEFFLTESRTGHCEYFASAMAAMCRQAGIDARVVTGYVAAEFNETSGTYTIRQSHAHAWVEAGVERWETFDPTPPADLSRLHRPEATIGHRIRGWLDSLEYAWNSSFVSFDERRRQDVMGDAGGAQRRWIDRMSNRMARAAGERRASSTSWIRPIGAAIAVAMVLAAAFVAGRAVWRLARRRAAPVVAHRGATARLLRRLDAVLRRRGLPRPASAGLLQHAAAIEAADPDAARATRLASELIYAERFGGRAADPAAVSAALSVLSGLAKVERS